MLTCSVIACNAFLQTGSVTEDYCCRRNDSFFLEKYPPQGYISFDNSVPQAVLAAAALMAQRVFRLYGHFDTSYGTYDYTSNTFDGLPRCYYEDPNPPMPPPEIDYGLQMCFNRYAGELTEPPKCGETSEGVTYCAEECPVSSTTANYFYFGASCPEANVSKLVTCLHR